MVGVMGGGGIGFRQVHLPWARRARGPASGPPLYWLSASLNLTMQMMMMMMVMKATTPPTIPMMTESMLVRPLDCLGWAVGKVGLMVGRLVVGSKMISSSDSVGLVLGGEKVTSTVVVGVPSQVSSASVVSTNSLPASCSGAEHRTFLRSWCRVLSTILLYSHSCILRALQSQ